MNKRPSLRNLQKVERTASLAQVNKLLVMLSTDGYIEGTYDRYSGEWEYDIDQAIEWVQSQMNYSIKRLEDLTQKQIGACYQELGG